MNSYRYYNNKECEYYNTCHGGVKKNCMFCFCPLYNTECIGNYVILDNVVKDCSKCMLPHTEKGYDYIINELTNIYKRTRDD